MHVLLTNYKLQTLNCTNWFFIGLKLLKKINTKKYTNLMYFIKICENTEYVFFRNIGNILLKYSTANIFFNINSTNSYNDLLFKFILSERKNNIIILRIRKLILVENRSIKYKLESTCY